MRDPLHQASALRAGNYCFHCLRNPRRQTVRQCANSLSLRVQPARVPLGQPLRYHMRQAALIAFREMAVPRNTTPTFASVETPPQAAQHISNT